MTPFLSSTGGSRQDALILVEVFAVTVKPTGALEGATILLNNNLHVGP